MAFCIEILPLNLHFLWVFASAGLRDTTFENLFLVSWRRTGFIIWVITPHASFMKNSIKKCIRCQHSNHGLNDKYIRSLLGNIYTTFCPKTRIAIRNFLTQIIGLRRNGNKKDKKKRIWYTPPHTFLCGYACDENLWKSVYFLFVIT